MIVNGKKLEYKDGINIKMLLEELSVDPDLVVVEVDGKIISKEEYGRKLEDKNKIEIVSFVGGG